MKLTVFSDYSLRTLMYLSVNNQTLVTISDIADRYKISKNHLMKVVNMLSQAGFVETVRGRSGGLRLARSARDIRLGDVIKKMEHSSTLVECFEGGKGECVLMGVCKLEAVLYEAQQSFYKTLNNYTLADISHNNKGLKNVLLEVVNG